MKKYSEKRHPSSLYVLIIPLVIAFIVIMAAVVFGKNSTELRSKAASSGWQQCINACNTGFNNTQRWIVLDPARCAAGCKATVVDKSMSCQNFCTDTFNTNVSQINKSNAKRDNSYGVQYCKNMCNVWVRKGNNPPISTNPTPIPGVATATPTPKSGSSTTKVTCKIDFCQAAESATPDGVVKDPMCMTTTCTQTSTPGGSGTTKCVSKAVPKWTACKE